MSFFDDVGKKIAQTSQGAAQKAKNIAETVKLNGMISDEESRIKDLFTQIGRTYYEACGGNAPEPQFADYVAGINDASAKIAAYNDQIKQLKGIVKCAKCGGDVPVNSAFCNNCGTAVIAASTAPATTSGANRCSACGMELAADTAFCTGCGNKIEQAAAPETNRCSVCGKALAADDAFCIGCGNKIDKQQGQ